MKPIDENSDPTPLTTKRLPKDDGGIISPPPLDTGEERPAEPPPPTTQPPQKQPPPTTTPTPQPPGQLPATQPPPQPPAKPVPPPPPPPAPQPPAAPPEAASELLQYLPTVYHEDPFVGRFLMAFEDVFLDLESSVARIADFFTPHRAPKEFLPWLAKWTALSLRADLDENQQRDFIANVIQLYRWRGSRVNLQRLLKIFTGGEAVITEDADTPHYFYVALSLPKEWREKPVEFLGRKKEIAYDLIDLEKPAHTFYKLDFIYPSMQVGVRSTVGKDTVLGVGLRE